MAIAKDLSVEGPVFDGSGVLDVDGLIASVVDTVERLDSAGALNLLAGLRGRLDGIELTVLARSYRNGASSRQVEGLLKKSSNMSNRDAANRARRSETGSQLDRLVDDLTAGVITGEQADLLVDAATATSPDAVNADSRFLERVSNTPVDQARKFKNEWVKDRQTDDELVEIHQIQRKARTVKFWSTAEGMTALYAEFDPITGKQIQVAVEADADRLYRDDGGRDTPSSKHSRTNKQRLADALTNRLLGSNPDSANAGNTKTGSGTGVGGRGGRPQIVVTATVDTPTGELVNPELIGVGPIPRHMFDYLACDSTIVGTLFSGDGAVLWQGRNYRTVTDAQWVALVARDKGCVECGADPSRCEAHHVVPWSAPAKGRTDIDNLALVCRVCHPALHETGQTLYQTSLTSYNGSTGNRKQDRNGGDINDRDDDSYRIWHSRAATPEETPAPRPKPQYTQRE